MPLFPPDVRETSPEPRRRRGRHDPYREIEELQDRLGVLLERALGEERGLSVSREGWTPLVDIEETDEAWLFEADLPGVRPEDVNVEVHDSELSVAGEIKEREHTGILRRQTRRTGRFDYRVRLPATARGDEIEARLQNGVLTIRVPKPERTEAHRVEVKGED
jgi:HSP20 family protein